MTDAAPAPLTIPGLKYPVAQIEVWPIERLVPYARNARTHSKEQIAQLRASIREFGWTNPVLAREDGSIIAGHGRRLAAVEEKITHVPVIVPRGWTEAQIKAYVLADNQLALNAGWDMDALKIELQDLDQAGFDLSLTGFSDFEIGKLLDTGPAGGLTNPDATPGLPEHPATKPGDVWILGNHRIVCGDATSADVVAKVLGLVKPHLMVTDPPYGVEYDPKARSDALKDGRERAEGKVENDDRADWREAWALFPGDVAYVWHAGVHGHTVAASLEVAGFKLRSQIIWRKQHFVIGRGDYHWQHEPCWYAVRKTATEHWNGSRKESTIWDIANADACGGDKDEIDAKVAHGTQKPVECMRRPIENNSSAGHAIYEPFCGSGTTIIACEQTGRQCLAIELSPAYVDVSVMRWQQFTGKDAVLESTGETFTARGGKAEPLTAAAAPSASASAEPNPPDEA